MAGQRLCTKDRAKRALAAVALVAAGLLTPAAAAADPPATDWARLRVCESTDRYGIATGNGYYGAYQFDLPTWRSVGGTGYPHRATPAEQDHRALHLYRMRGWQPWTCARKLGLPTDADARSGRVPTYADSAYIGAGGPAASSGTPAWPGKVYVHGDCDPPLRAWQLRMNTFGYTFQGTGCYFAQTRAAVLALQRANGIPDTGRLGPRTWRAAWHGNRP